MSEPAKIYTQPLNAGVQDSTSEFEEEEELLGGKSQVSDLQDGGAADALDPSSSSSAVPMVAHQMMWPIAMMNSTMFAPPVESALPMPQVGLAGPTHPHSSQQQRAGTGNRGKERDKSYHCSIAISQLKNNDITNQEPPWTDVTTVMMRNLPNKYKQQMLLDELQDAGFRLQADFDFFYLPMDHTNAANLGYCFINFVETPTANAFAETFQGKKMRRFNSSKTVVVMPASIQGYERNYRYYSSTRVSQAEDPAYRPLFLRPETSSQEDKKGGYGQGAGRGRGTGGEKGAAGRGGGKAKARSKDKGGGKGVEALGKLAFMGLDQGGYDGGFGGGMAPWPGMSQDPNCVTCMHCGNLCNIEHRFCSGCGNLVQGGGGPQLGGCFTGLAPCSMRADAPTFNPSTSLQANRGQRGQQMQEPYSSPTSRNAPSTPSRTEPTSQLTESVSNELDVMRGRLLLIAALKEIEQRESGGNSSDLARTLAGLANNGAVPGNGTLQW